MNKQITLSAFSDELATVRTKKKEFLSQIERIVPWGEWIEEIRPCYYKGERGNKPYDLDRCCDMTGSVYGGFNLCKLRSCCLRHLKQPALPVIIRFG